MTMPTALVKVDSVNAFSILFRKFMLGKDVRFLCFIEFSLEHKEASFVNLLRKAVMSVIDRHDNK